MNASRSVRESCLNFVQVFILIVAIIRGLCLIEDPDATIAYLGWSGGLNPAWVWGGVTIFLGALGIFGEAWMSIGRSRHRWLASFTAHSGLAGLYIVYGLSAINYVAMNTTTHPEVIGSFATAIEIASYSLFHWLFANRSKNAHF